MSVRRRDILKVVGGSVVAAATVGLTEEEALAHRLPPLYRDVCILGGGSAGTYSAVRLQDEGHSVVVVERKDRLGGHAETHVDPASGVPIDIGVIVFENVSLVTSYFGRFGVPLVPLNLQGGETSYVDFKTGELLSYEPPSQAEFIGALLTYRQILAQDYPYLDDGFELPDPVPLELALPFSNFVEKHGLQALFPIAFQYGQGLGNTLEAPAIYVLKNFSAAVVDSILGVGFLGVPGGVAGLYDVIASALGDDVLYSTRILSVSRGGRGRYPVCVHVRTPKGHQMIHCKKLLVAFPPSPKGFMPLDLDRSEQSLFSRLRPNHYSTGVVRLSGLPPHMSLQNVGDETTYDLPSLPGIYGLSPTGAPGLWNVKYGSARPLSDWQVKWAIVRDIHRIARAGTFPVRFEGFATFSNHSPFELMTSPAGVARGFYKRLNALQGHRDTFYTGATFQTHDSSLIWRFTEGLLPKLFA